MRIKSPLTESSRDALRRHVHRFRCARADQGRAVVEVAEILGCHVDEALDFCNSQESTANLIFRYGVEIAPDEPDEPGAYPTEDESIDRETWRLCAYMAAGVELLFLSLWWMFGG